MTRGKYAAKAERHRGLAEAEQRAVTAERERDRLAAELAEVRQHGEGVIGGLRAYAADLRKQRDGGAAPAIEVLERENRRLRGELTSVTIDRDQLRAELRPFMRRLTVFLCEQSVCSHLLEARAIICMLTQASSLRGMLPPADEDAARERTATT